MSPIIPLSTLVMLLSQGSTLHPATTFEDYMYRMPKTHYSMRKRIKPFLFSKCIGSYLGFLGNVVTPI